MRFVAGFIALAVWPCVVTTAESAVRTYYNSDDGAAVGSSFPNSRDAEKRFLAAAGIYGPIELHGFGGRPLGFYSPIIFGRGDAQIDLSAPNLGVGRSGITNTSFGNQSGFAIGGGGARWLGFPQGSATFRFTEPANSFGGYFTGLNSSAGGSLTVSFNDGSNQLLTLPMTSGGGAQYFGFTDTASFSELTISRSGTDFWGLDRVSFNVANDIALPIAGRFDLSVTKYGTYYIDPLVATGYQYKTGLGDPNFHSVILPGIQDQYALNYEIGGNIVNIDLNSNTTYFFPDEGVSSFKVTGIDTALGLDPNDPGAFVTGVSFVADGRFTGTQIPIVTSVPEPSTWAMMLIGFFGLAWRSVVRNRSQDWPDRKAQRHTIGLQPAA